MERMALVHEIVHGLQDQNFDLSNYMPPKLEGDDDSLTAAQCLYEGDASWTSLLYVQKNFNPLSDLGLALESLQASGNQIKDVPPYLVESLLFPYQEGLAFVRYLYEQGGFDSVNEAFLHPPSSSEQIIHPEKYLAKEEPQDIIFSSPYALSDWTTVRQNTLGEFDFRFLFREVLSEEEALNASAGWAGSHYLYAEKGTDKAFILISQWDSVKDAQEAYFGLEAYLKGRFSFALRAFVTYGDNSGADHNRETPKLYVKIIRVLLFFFFIFLIRRDDFFSDKSGNFLVVRMRVGEVSSAAGHGTKIGCIFQDFRQRNLPFDNLIGAFGIHALDAAPAAV